MQLHAFLCTLVLSLSPLSAIAADWLLDPTPFQAQITRQGDDVVLENGLVRRVIRIAPGVRRSRSTDSRPAKRSYAR